MKNLKGYTNFPKNVLKWADKMYELDHSIVNAYGESAPNSTLTLGEDGNFTWNELPEGEYISSYLYQCVLQSGMPCFIPDEVYGSDKLPYRDDQIKKIEIYDMYEPYLDPEVWPRPYYSVDEADRLSELTTDIFSLVEISRAKWICGQAELNDASWKQYLSEMETMCLDEMMEIYQNAYDRYLDGMPK